MLKALNGNGFALEAKVVNDGLSAGDVLNSGCGADFVKVQQKCPRNLESVQPLERCVSVDGDADRVVYFFKQKSGDFQLMDGDKIATLVAGYFKEMLKESGVDLALGLVQTAYANGSSTKYITEKLVCISIRFDSRSICYLKQNSLKCFVACAILHFPEKMKKKIAKLFP